MSVKNLSQKNYDRFVKNKNIDIFSQEQIKNIPRHRLVMMNNGKGETYWPFNVHSLHNHLKHSNKHPVFRSVRVSPDAKKRIRDKYIASLRHDVKAMLSASSRVSEDAFVKALKKARLSNTIINTLVKARRNKTVPNTVVQNMHSNTIEQVIRTLRANNKNNTKVPNNAKAFVIAQRRKHNDMLWRQQKHQAEIELNTNQNALRRASSIAQKVIAERAQYPSKTEFKFPELGFKMNIQDRNTIIMTWYPPSRKRDRSGKVLFPPASSSIRVPIRKMDSTIWRSMSRSLSNTWLVPEISDRIPGSRATAMQMSKAVLLLSKEKVVTDKNMRNNNNDMNVSNINMRDNNMTNDDQVRSNDVETWFYGAGLEVYPVSHNNKVVSNIIRKVLTSLRNGNDHLSVGVHEVHILFVDVYLDGTLIREAVHTDLSGLNINRVAQSNKFTTIDLNQYRGRGRVSIRIFGNFRIQNNMYTFDIDIDPHVNEAVRVEIG
jgi:hypothetical protein